MKVRSAQGLARIGAEAYGTVLVSLIRPWLLEQPVPVIVVGLAGVHRSEEPGAFRPVPAQLSGTPLLPMAEIDPRIDLFLLPGLRQADGPGVLDGADIPARGLFAARSDFDGVLCLPGEETRWLRLSGGEIRWFETHPTWELLTRLAPVLGTEADINVSLAGHPGFETALTDTRTGPERLFQQLSRLRIEADTGDAQQARARLAGHLIGAELAATRAHGNGHPVLVAGHGRLADAYRRGLELFGVEVEHCDPDPLILDGFRQVAGSVPSIPA